MVEEPGSEADRRIRDPVQGLRAVAHLLRVSESVGEEEVEPLERAALLVGQAGRRAVAVTQCLEDFWRDGGRHVGVNRHQLRRRDHAEDLGHQRAPVAALRGEAGVAEPLHQRQPGLGDARRVPAGGGRPLREAIARHRRDHDIERVLRGAAMRGRIGQRLDDLQLLDDRARPAVGDDDRQRIFVLRLDVDEVDVEPVDVGDEVGQGVQPRLDLAPVIVVRPIVGELLHRRQLHALAWRR